jgi:hydroxymethylpyrimidine pyrophosphatase-like HAD family hydrolase
MVGYFRAIAADFDGTLTDDGQRPMEAVLDGLSRARASGLIVFLVTGRITSELRSSFPDLDEYVDVVVAENGCVLVTADRTRRLATPVDEALVDALNTRGVSVRRGDVLLAGSAKDRAITMEEIHRLELDSQLVFNRSEMMILPSGVTKGSGLFDALGDLGISRHSTIGVGDAENDYSLLDVCEVGAAVANAVPGLKAVADVVLPEASGRGVLGLLDLVQRADAPAIHSARWQVQLGVTPTGSPVSLPSSQVNVLVCGGSGSGKSYMAGLFAERLIAQGYCVLVVDPEGDHQGLGRLRGVVVIDARDRLPAPHRVVDLFLRRFTSVVLDLSLVPPDRRHAYLEQLTAVVDASRAASGLPHWVISDEAHESATGMHSAAIPIGESASGRWGSCLVTYRPDLIEPDQIQRTDAVIALGTGREPNRHIVELITGVHGGDPEWVRQQLRDIGPGSGLLVPRIGDGAPRPFHIGTRVTEHRRHLLKYLESHLSPERSFHFRDGRDRHCGTASNIGEMRATLQNCADGVIEHHALGSDLSRWIRGVFGDEELADRIEDAESLLSSGAIGTDEARRLMVRAVRDSYVPGPRSIDVASPR